MHFCALVILPEGAETNPEIAVAAILAPYDENLWSPDEDGDSLWWDWWRIGGRFDGQILGLDQLSEDTHYSDEWEQPERNMARVRDIAEFDTYTIVGPDGDYRHKEMVNPAWREEDGYEHYFVDTPDFAEFRARLLLAHRDAWAVVVDYHS